MEGILMKKKILVAAVSVIMALSMVACGTFTCDLCGQEKSGKKHSQSILGQEITVCDDCVNGVTSLFGF